MEETFAANKIFTLSRDCPPSRDSFLAQLNIQLAPTTGEVGTPGTGGSKPCRENESKGVSAQDDNCVEAGDKCSANPGNCTGCEICVPFCPVNCIEVAKAKDHPDRPIPPVYVRENECIGCTICARVCTKMAWDAISMVPTAELEKALGVTFTEKFIPDKKPA